jgi:hypothetical protein
MDRVLTRTSVPALCSSRCRPQGHPYAATLPVISPMSIPSHSWNPSTPSTVT